MLLLVQNKNRNHGVGFQFLQFPHFILRGKATPMLMLLTAVDLDVFNLLMFLKQSFVFAFTCGSGGTQGCCSSPPIVRSAQQQGTCANDVIVQTSCTA